MTRLAASSDAWGAVDIADIRALVRARFAWVVAVRIDAAKDTGFAVASVERLAAPA